MRNRRRIQRRGPLIVYGKDEVNNFFISCRNFIGSLFRIL